MTDKIIGKGWAFPPQIDARGSVALVSKETELNQAIRIILATPLGQRVMRPRFGCRIHELVFMPNNSETAGQAERFCAGGAWDVGAEDSGFGCRCSAESRPRQRPADQHQLRNQSYTR